MSELFTLLILLEVIGVSVSASSYVITVETSKPFYLVGENINIHGKLTYNDWPIQSQLIAIQVQNSSGTTILLWTAATDSNGAFNMTFKLSPEAEIGTYMVLTNHNAITNRTAFNVIKFLGDVNADGKVDLKDVFAVAKAFNSYPGSPSWNPLCDVNLDGKVDLKDYYMTCQNYGRGVA
jgi:hypothetical protein